MTQFRICKNLVILLTWYWVSRVMDFFSQFQSNPTSSKVIFALTFVSQLLLCMGNVQTHIPSDYGFFICILDSRVWLIAVNPICKSVWTKKWPDAGKICSISVQLDPRNLLPACWLFSGPRVVVQTMSALTLKQAIGVFFIRRVIVRWKLVFQVQ